MIVLSSRCGEVSAMEAFEVQIRRPAQDLDIETWAVWRYLWPEEYEWLAHMDD